jgi:hypothetical protein
MTDVLLPERVEIAESIGPGVVWPAGSAGSALAPDAGYAIDLLALSPRADIAPAELLGRGARQSLLRFMEFGPFNSRFDDELQALYLSLPYEPPRGHPLALNDSAAFKTYARMGDSLPYLALLNGKAMPLGGTFV